MNQFDVYVLVIVSFIYRLSSMYQLYVQVVCTSCMYWSNVVITSFMDWLYVLVECSRCMY